MHRRCYAEMPKSPSAVYLTPSKRNFRVFAKEHRIVSFPRWAADTLIRLSYLTTHHTMTQETRAYMSFGDVSKIGSFTASSPCIYPIIIGSCGEARGFAINHMGSYVSKVIYAQTLKVMSSSRQRSGCGKKSSFSLG